MEDSSDVTILSKSVPLISAISDERIRSNTAAIFMQLLRESKWPNLERQPMLSFLKISGIEHLNAVVEMCLSTAKIIEKSHGIKIKTDFLISGAILHDASKLVEYEPTEEGERKTKWESMVSMP